MRPQLFVIRVEELFVARIKGAVAGNVGRENKCFEEPGGMRQMPFHGTGVRHRLQHLVFRRIRPAQLERGPADFLIAFAKGTTSQLLRMAGVHRTLQSRVLADAAVAADLAASAWMR